MKEDQVLFETGSFVQRFVREDAGQDLIEYALLTAIITVGSLAVLAAIRVAMAAAYVSWGNEVQVRWEPPPPIVP